MNARIHFASLRAIFLAVFSLLAGCSTGKKLAFQPFEVSAHTEITPSEVPKFRGIKAFLNADNAEEQIGLYLLEPFDRKRIPILFIHGLFSDPTAWESMLHSLRMDPEILANYQFLFYSYPTSIPVVPSAAIFKKHLDQAIREIEGEYGFSMERKLVVIGHSMGGILAKSLVSSSGDALWNQAFRAPLKEFNLTADQREMVAKAFRYEPRSYVGEVIFIASPQYGSHLANSRIGSLGSLLSDRPKMIEDLAESLVTKNRERLQPEFADFVAKKVNAISTLRPDSPVTQTLADMPVDPAVTYHILAGVKNGRRGNIAKAGDGVVPFWSTNIPNVGCRIAIESGHGVHQTSEAAEITRLLLLHRLGKVTIKEMEDAIRKMDLPFAQL